ncbi:MAG: carboxypeptidase regulatory-like domain-containing protein, partial [Myxococcales bacterium]|nr:carboxypeptidase regulatory-like domain-containing protein [Myxococcales bacterium]
GEGFGDEGEDGFGDEGDGGDFGGDAECGDDGFCFEDLSDDEAAAAAEVESDVKKIKGPSGVLKGTVRDATSGSPLIGVEVKVVGTKYSAETDVSGNYTLYVPPGTYSVRIRYDTYEGVTIDNVAVAQDKEVSVNHEMKPIAGMTQTVVVEAELNNESAAGKLIERKKSASARDMMSRDDISKSGGGSTSSVARRIVGSTVVGGRYLFVRGLGHRYGNTLFDGARVPSPDPNLRTVPLDIFPSSALGAINIQKTAMPDTPADFAGASTQLESREAPEDFTWELGADFEVNTATSFRDGLRGDYFTGDNAAFGNLGRRLPDSHDTDFPINPDLQDSNLQSIWSPDEIKAFGLGIPSTRTQLYSYRALPNFGAKGAIGTTFHPWGTDLGVLASAGYDHSTQTERISQIIVQRVACPAGWAAGDGPCELARNATTGRYDPRTEYYNNLKTTVNVRWSGLALLKWRLSKSHRLELLGMYTRDADNESRRLGEFIPGGPSRTPATNQDAAANTRLRYQMRSILFTRLGGKHEFPKAKDFTVEWFGSYAQARQDDPLLREMQFRETTVGGGEYQIERNESARFQFMNLLDNTATGALDLSQPFKQWRQLDAKFKAGGWVEGKWRRFNSRTFRYTLLDGVLPPEGTGDIINDSTIGGGDPADPSTPFYLKESTREFDQYNGVQKIYAGYAQLELPFVRWFKLAGGARYEMTDITVSPYDLFTGEINDADSAALISHNVLPTVALIFSPRSDMNVRLTGYETLARPELRELAPFRFTDFVGGYDVLGEPDLLVTKIWNADLRYEWFPSANEVIAISGFYKYFVDPIESFVVAGQYVKSYQNALFANNVGGELELRKNLEFIHKSIRDLSVGVNFAYIYSRVHIRLGEELEAIGQNGNAASTNAVRPLQGQSPFVFNAYVSYDNEQIGLDLRLLYNTFGKRIEYIGGGGLDDIYLQPVHTLDFVLSQRLYKGLSLGFKAANLLNWTETQRQADQDVQALRRGISFSLGLSYKH